MIISIIVTIIACIGWWWLIQQSLQFYRLRQSTIRVLLGLSVLGVSTIISFPHWYERIYGVSWIHPLTVHSTSTYIVYIFVISLIISGVVFYRGGIQIFWQQLCMIVIIAGISIGVPALGWYPLYYALIAASIEEYIKYYLGYGGFSLYAVTGSDIILFGLMSGLGFACIENIVYLYTMSDTVMISSNIARRIVGPIVHMVYSGGLAYGYWYLHRTGRGIGGLLGSMMVMIALHTGYNLWIVQSSWLVIVLVLLGGYAIMSWMLYQCDRLYFTAKNNLKTTG